MCSYDEWLAGIMDRAFGEVMGFCDGKAPYLVISNDDGLCAQEIPDISDGLCYVETYDGEDLCCFIEYNMPVATNALCVRVIDEEIRGMSDDELYERIFGIDGDMQAFAVTFDYRR